MTLSSNSPPSITLNMPDSSPSDPTLCPSPRTWIWWSRSAPQSPRTSPPGTAASETCSGNTCRRNPPGTPPWCSLSRRQQRSNKTVNMMANRCCGGEKQCGGTTWRHRQRWFLKVEDASIVQRIWVFKT